MAGAGTELVDLVLFYTIERLLFNKLVSTLSKNPQQVKSAITIWLVLEEIGYHNLIRTIHSLTNDTIEAIFNEALLCVHYLHPAAAEPPKSNHELPIFVNLFDEPMNLRFFHYNRRFLSKRYVHIMNNVCNKIFGHVAALEVDVSGERPVVVMAPAVAAREAAPAASTLNPYASEFSPSSSGLGMMVGPEEAEEDTRVLFLTFSKGYPLSRLEVVTFFTTNWGDCVEDLYMDNNDPPQFGRIVLTSAAIANTILSRQQKAEFRVNRRDLWVRRFYANKATKDRDNV